MRQNKSAALSAENIPATMISPNTSGRSAISPITIQ
jgi:hypothetical protein